MTSRGLEEATAERRAAEASGNGAWITRARARERAAKNIVESEFDNSKHPRGRKGQFIDVMGKLKAGLPENDVRRGLQATLDQAKHGDTFDVSGIHVEKIVKEGKPFAPGLPPRVVEKVKFEGALGGSEFATTGVHGILRLAKEKAERDAAPAPVSKKGGKGKLTHVTPDGVVHTRRTDNPYTHVVEITHQGSPHPLSWHRSGALAEKAASSARRNHQGVRVAPIKPA